MKTSTSAPDASRAYRHACCRSKRVVPDWVFSLVHDRKQCLRSRAFAKGGTSTTPGKVGESVPGDKRSPIYSSCQSGSPRWRELSSVWRGRVLGGERRSSTGERSRGASVLLLPSSFVRVARRFQCQQPLRQSAQRGSARGADGKGRKRPDGIDLGEVEGERKNNRGRDAGRNGGRRALFREWSVVRWLSPLLD
jgi:hypothetical protein